MNMRLSHVSWNLSGLLLPLFVAAISIPQLINKIGPERFGLLSLAWGLIGYAGILDLGIGRALTQMVASFRGEGKFVSIHSALITAERITIITGSLGGLLIVLIALIGGETWIQTKSIPKYEIKYSILLLAFALPAHSMSATYRGMNEAFLNFKEISILRIVLGIVNFGGPYLISFFTTVVFWLVAPLVVSRIMIVLMFRHLAKLCLKDNNLINIHAVYSQRVARSLFKFGGWASISSILSPLMTQADRFLVASIISATAVTIYVIPYEVVVQSLVVVSAITAVVFPSMSSLIHENNKQWKSYFQRWLIVIMGLMFIICVLMLFILPMGLQWWLKENYSAQSALIGQVLCFGVFANAFGSMYYALLHAKGRADLTAKVHMVELPIFIFCLILFLNLFGLIGAAWAWVGRMIFDAIALFLCSRLIRD